MNKMVSEKDKKGKERVKFQDYKETFNATAAKAIKRDTTSSRMIIKQRMKERKYKKYYFNEDSEEGEVVSSDEETQMIKCKPKITSVQNVQIKPRLTSKEIHKAMHSKLEQHEEAEEIKESVLKVRHEI